jgi:hypothetical protein
MDFFMYFIQQRFICRPLDSTVSEDAGIKPRTIASWTLTVRRSNHSARSHPYLLLSFERRFIVFTIQPLVPKKNKAVNCVNIAISLFLFRWFFLELVNKVLDWGFKICLVLVVFSVNLKKEGRKKYNFLTRKPCSD